MFLPQAHGKAMKPSPARWTGKKNPIKNPTASTATTTGKNNQGTERYKFNFRKYMLSANTEANPVGVVEHRQGCNPCYIAYQPTNPVGVTKRNDRDSCISRKYIITSET